MFNCLSPPTISAAAAEFTAACAEQFLSEQTRNNFIFKKKTFYTVVVFNPYDFTPLRYPRVVYVCVFVFF